MLRDVQRRKLPNGLTVLVKPDRRSPLACILTWANVGYFNEPDDVVGISHFVEHMYFKGTSTRKVGEIAEQTKAVGGYLNAATIYDYTYYYTVVPSTGLSQALEIQSDALLNPTFDPVEIEREKEVIVAELKKKLDSPDAFAWEKLLSTAFDRHRIRRWRMGTEEDIRRYTREMVFDHYKRYYRASNMTLAVVGDFDTDDVMKQVEALYSSLNGDPVVREVSPREPEQSAPRLMRLTGDVSRTLLKVGFHAPAVFQEDYFPMQFLATVLGRGRSSRLFRSLKEEKGIVDAVATSFYASADVSYFTVEAELKAEQLAACEEEIWVEIDRIRRDPPTPQEIDKVRNIIEANFFSEHEDVMGQAYGLSYFESLGGYERLKEYIENLRGVTAGDLVRVAERYFAFRNMSIMEYVPTSVGEGAPSEARIESLKKRVASRVEKGGPVGKPLENVPVSPIVFSATAGDRGRRTVEVIPMGGVTLLHLPANDVPLAAVAAYFPGGRLDETEENCGITQFVLRNSLKGTERRTADEFAFDVESLGAGLHVEATADIFGYGMSLPSRNFEKAIDLMSDAVVRPTFPEIELEKERTSALASIRRAKDDMFHHPIELFYKALFGLHAYGLPRGGTESSLERFSRAQVADWYAQTYRWRKLVVVVAGDVDRQRAIDRVKESFGVSTDTDEESRAQIYPVVPMRGAREAAEERDRKQTGFVLGFVGVNGRDPRYYALEVARNILSGMGGRLFMELREKRSLVYSVAAFNIGLMRGGAFFVYAAASPEREAEARDVLVKELNRLRTTPPPLAELNAAKAYTRGSHAISLQKSSAIAYEHLHHYMTGRGIEELNEYDRRIEEVTAGDVRRVVEEIFVLDQCAVGVVRGKAK